MKFNDSLKNLWQLNKLLEDNFLNHSVIHTEDLAVRRLVSKRDNNEDLSYRTYSVVFNSEL